jgi:hypothetical protein
MSEKHLFTNGEDTLIAKTAEEAMETWEDYTGDVDRSMVWEMVPDDDPFTVYFEDEIRSEYLPENRTFRQNLTDDETMDFPWTHCITAKARDWANCNWQDDFLCTTEY